jgi:hypothetical protein
MLFTGHYRRRSQAPSGRCDRPIVLMGEVIVVWPARTRYLPLEFG